VKSTAAFENFNPAVPRDFVFDPASERLLVGGRNLPKVFGHSGLAGVGGFDEGTVVDGQLIRSPGGEFLTNEWSGHFGMNWTDAVRQQFSDCMSALVSIRFIPLGVVDDGRPADRPIADR
jgi:hypothetical protein